MAQTERAKGGGVRERLKLLARPDNLETNDRAAGPRFLAAFVTAAIAGYWIGWGWALVWLGAILAHERLVSPALTSKVIIPNFEKRPHLVEWTVIAMSVGGAALYAVAWIAAWAAGGRNFAFFAGIMLAATYIHALTYLTRTPLAFAMGTAPATLLALWVMITGDHGAPLILMLLNVMQLAYISITAMRDRNALSRKLVEYRSEKKAAEQANRAKTSFLAAMSHELRTPLNAIIGYAEILQEDLAEGQGVPEDAARIGRAGRALLAMINDVLDFSKIEAGKLDLKPEAIDVVALLGDVLGTVAHIANANGDEIVLDADPAIGVRTLDGQRLRQCVLNLASNACKFTRAGRVTITARVAADSEGALLSVVVTDTGAGISEADLAKLFQPFVQADNSKTRTHDGTGLGLAICRRLANLMGGDVTVTSELGKGSAFTLTVRVGAPEAVPATRAAA